MMSSELEKTPPDDVIGRSFELEAEKYWNIGEAERGLVQKS